MSKEYRLLQYATGRSDTDIGYNFHRTSDSGVRITEWMRGKTRASTIADEVPTMEVKPNLGENGVGDFVLVESRHVSARYKVDDEGMYKEKCRSYDYSHYLIMPLPENSQADTDRPKAAIEMLACSEYFLDVYNYQQVSEDEKMQIPFEDIMIDERKLQANWRAFANEWKYPGELKDENLAAFLARYWEACWNIYKGETIDPLVVVATSPERNSEKEGDAVIPDGLIFFHDQVLPHLPKAVQQMLCVSFGCLVEQNAAQAGTACRVCYPESEAIRADRVYRVYHNQVKDDMVDDACLRLGKAMISGDMPAPYKALQTMEDTLVMEQNFDFAHMLADYEILMEELGQAETVQDQGIILGDCTKGLNEIAMMLWESNFTEQEVIKILYSYELELAGLAEKYGKIYSQETYTSWLRLYESIEQFGDRLTEQEKSRLMKAWRRVLVKEYDPVDWESFPLSELLRDNLDEEWASLLTDVLKNGQKYTKDFGDEQAEVGKKLLNYQLKARIGGYSELAETMLSFLIQINADSEKQLSPTVYTEALSQESMISRETAELLKTDYGRLIERHIQLRRKYPFQSADHVIEELDLQAKIREAAENSPMNFTEDDMVSSFPELETIVPNWCIQSSVTFNRSLYERLLSRAADLRLPNRTINPEVLTGLNETYRQCLLKTYISESQADCAMAVFASRDWKETEPWEAELLNNALAGKATPCGESAATDRLIDLRTKGKNDTADLWLALLQTVYANSGEILNDYLYKTQELTVDAACQERMQSDVVEIIRHNSDGMDSYQIRNLDLLTQWYTMKDGYKSQELKQILNAKYIDELRERIDFRKDEADLVRQYCEAQNLAGSDPEFSKVLIGQFEDMTLSEISNRGDALTALKMYQKKDNGIIQMLREIIGKKITEDDDLQASDVLNVLQISEQTEIQEMTKEISDILVKTPRDQLTPDIMEGLSNYAVKHNRGLDEIRSAIRLRAEHDDRENWEQHIAELLRFLRQSEVTPERKARVIQEITGELKDHREEDSLIQKELMKELVPAAKDAIAYQPKVKGNIINLFESGEVSVQFAQMNEFAEALEITSMDVANRKDSKWSQFFLSKETERFGKYLDEEKPTVSQILEMAEDVDSPAGSLDRLIRKNSDQAGSAEALERTRSIIPQQLKKIISQDRELEEPNKLSAVISKLNNLKTDSFIVSTLINESNEYIGKLLKDDERFSKLACDAESIRNLSTCMRSLKIDDNENLKSLKTKENAIRNACELMDRYDEAETSKEFNSELIHKAIEKTDINGWQYVSSVCFDYGNEKLKNASTEMKLIPYLFNALEANGDTKRINWEQFLNSARPLESKGGWRNANIWKSEENTYGFISMVLNWLSQDGLKKEEKKSFLSFLNASEIGRKAHSGKEARQIQAHYQERMKNNMLDWILNQDDTKDQ